MNHHENIVSLDAYRQCRHDDNQPDEASVRAKVEFTEEDQKILDRMNHPHPAGKQLAFEAMIQNPDLTVRHIQDTLRKQEYSDDVVDAVKALADHMKESMPGLRTEEFSQTLYAQYSAMMKKNARESQLPERAVSKEEKLQQRIAQSGLKLVKG